MCGIVGFVLNNSAADLLKDNLCSALSLIQHRGPDDFGEYYHKNVGLGHVRLSIIDLSSAGHQPMVDVDGRFCITYNGEIYNYKELKEELINLGHTFRTDTDTEVIIESYKRYGSDCFTRLNGMFAFAIFDSKYNKLIVVRDRFGIKPLHVSVNSNGIYFSSEIKSMKPLIAEPLVLNKYVLPEWSFYGSALGENTFYKGIKKLQPGHFLEINTETSDVRLLSYWKPEFIKFPSTKNKLNEAIVVSKVKKLLKASVNRQLVGDVPIGVFLSGGIDSSAITAFAAEIYGNKLKTFSVGFDFDKGVNELPKARKVAEKFGTDHQELVISGYQLPDLVESLVYYHDSPFSDAANIPLYLLGQQVKSNVKVVLQGDGGDEIFAGYKRYQTLSQKKKWDYIIPFISFINSFTPRSINHFSRKRYINALSSRDDATLMALLLTAEDKKNNPLRIFSKQLQHDIAKINPFQQFINCNDRFSDKDLVQKMLFTDTQIILPDIFLDKVDRSTMATSIEVRVPFLDNDLTEYVMSLPSEMKVREGQKKYLLKQSLIGLVPDEILFGPKTGFGVPYKFWLKGPLNQLFNDCLYTLENQSCDYFDYHELRNLIRENSQGKRDHGFLLWKTLNFMIWLISEKRNGNVYR